MGIADRIILTLYTILMTVASVLTLLCSLGVFSDTGMVAFISHIPGNWVYAVGGVNTDGSHIDQCSPSSSENA